MFLIKWAGPFDSKEQICAWEKKREKDYNEKFNLYLLQGKQKSARKSSYYCGQTIRSVYKRLKDKDHHIREIESRDCKIWIGRFANKTPKKDDINIAEKMIISELCSYGVYGLRMLNRTNKRPPIYDVYIVNRWYNWGTGKEWQRLKKDVPAQFIPDLMMYDAESGEMKGIMKIKSLGILF